MTSTKHKQKVTNAAVSESETSRKGGFVFVVKGLLLGCLFTGTLCILAGVTIAYEGGTC